MVEPSPVANTTQCGGDVGDQYETLPVEQHSSLAALKGRIRHHYELASDYY